MTSFLRKDFTYTVNKEIELKRAERVHLGVDRLNYGVSGCRVFWEPHRKRWKTNSSHWADLRDGLRKRVLSALRQRLLFPLFLLCPLLLPPKKVVTDRLTAEQFAGSLTLNFDLLIVADRSGGLYFYLSALTPIQINFHSGKSWLNLFPFGRDQGHPSHMQVAFLFFSPTVVDYTEVLRGTN